MFKLRSISNINLIGVCAFVAATLAGNARAQTGGDWQWRNVSSAEGRKPEARRNGVAIYDPVGRRVVIFGGTGNTGLLNDTWAYAVETRVWTQLNTVGTPPTPRLGFDAVYDPVGRQMLIYAGQGAGLFNDTWTLNLDTLEWRDVSPAEAARPRKRYGSASIYDPVTRSLVQFAGFTSEAGRFQDTQSFSPANRTWQDWTPSGAKPQIRCLLTAAFDRTNRRMIIYGGQRSGALDDLWAFDLATRTWTELTPAQRPAGRWFAASFVDRDGRFIIFGGFTSGGNANDVWAFDQSTRRWSQVQIANPPTPRNGMLGAQIESEDRLLLFGGSSNEGLMNDVWELRRAAAPTVLTAVSAASFSGNQLAAESIAAAFGANLATATQTATTTPLPTTLAGTTLRVRDSAGLERSAPLFFVSPTQLNFLVPAGTAAGAATLTVTSGDGATAVGTINIAAVAPALFAANASGQGVAAAVAQRFRADGSSSFEPIAQWDAARQQFVAVPLELGPETDQVFLILFGTAFRQRTSLNAVTARLGGVDAPVGFAGAQGDLLGLDQANLRIPRSLSGRGEVEVVLTVDGREANKVQIGIR